MEQQHRRRNIQTRVIRPGEPVPTDWNWENSTMEERINAVWDLTLFCFGWDKLPEAAVGSDRVISRIERRKG